MVTIAHVAGIPLEELLLPVISGAGALWIAVRALGARIRRRPDEFDT